MTQKSTAVFGAQLRLYRARAGLSQEELAERAGLTASTIAALERGRRRRPYPHTTRLLAAALGLSAEERVAFGEAVPWPGSDRAAPPPPAAPPPSHLPGRRTSLVGREREVAALRDLVTNDEARLVTLTGVGGAGKTRLALQVATDLQDAFPGGAWFVDLAPVADPALVAQAVATALAVRETAGVPLLDTLAAWLQPRALLLVLDNCEHLLDACARLAERLLDACPAVRILATSREPLQIAGERRWRVPPLAVPNPDQPAALDELARYPAVRLFIERAQVVAPDFRLTDENAAAVAQACARLDGIPLALELAAARVHVLAVAQIVERLDDTVRLLTGGSRAAPTRQQTLRATLDWSYDLLAERERAVFRRLAVFAGGCDLEAAEAVCGDEAAGSRQRATGGTDSSPLPAARYPLPAGEVLDLLTRLVDRSLVVATVDAQAARYYLLEPVRQYGMQHLAACGEMEAARARHAAWYLSLAQRAAPELRGPAQIAWLGRLERERDNLRAALRWADACGDAQTGVRLAVALVSFWEAHGYLSEGRRWLKVLLAASRAGLIPQSVRGKALIGAGCLAHWQADLEEAGPLFEEGLALARELGDRQGIAESLMWLGATHRHQGDLACAARLCEESLALYRELEDKPGIAEALLNLSISARLEGDTAKATALGEESLTRYRELGDVRFIARARIQLGFSVLQEGDLGRAAALFRESLTGHQQVGDRWFIGHGIVGLAGVLGARAQPVLAARLLGAAEELRDVLVAPVAPINRTMYEPIVAAVRAQLSEAAFAAA